MDKILVTGATGKLGSELCRRLLARSVEVKAGTRDPDRAAAMFGDRAEVVELDYLRTETWDAAVMWADRIFLMPPPFDPKADEDLIPFLDWAVSSGTEHVVLLTAMGIESLEHVALSRIEARVRATGVPFTFLRPNWYMQNFLVGLLADPIRERGGFAIAAGDAAVSMVDARDVADAAAEVLCSDAHYGAAYRLTGPESLTFGRVAEIIATAAGRPVRYEAVDEVAMRRLLADAGWPDDHAQVLLGLLRSIREGARAEVTGDVAALLGREPKRLADFAAEHADAWRTRQAR